MRSLLAIHLFFYSAIEFGTGIVVGTSSPAVSLSLGTHDMTTIEEISIKTTQSSIDYRESLLLKTYPQYFLLNDNGFKKSYDIQYKNKRRPIVVVEIQAKRTWTDDDDNDINTDDYDFEVGEDEIVATADDEITFEEDLPDDDVYQDIPISNLGNGGGGGGGESINDDNDNGSLVETEEKLVAVEEDASETKTHGTILELKNIWKEILNKAQTDLLRIANDEIQTAIQRHTGENSSIIIDQPKLLSSVLSQYPLLLRANGTDRASFHRQLEVKR